MLKPLGDRVVVKPGEIDKVTPGGVLLPETMSREKPMEGTVVEVGEGRLNEAGVVIPLRVRKGDNVVFSRYSGVEIEHNNEVLLILRAEDILAIVEAEVVGQNTGKPVGE